MPTLRFLVSPLQEPHEHGEASSWGRFSRYVELGEDEFALRQADVYENGYVVCYDRAHWQDQFGSLADFRFGALWQSHWGASNDVSAEDFERQWALGPMSPPYAQRNSSPPEPAPWIEQFRAGRFRGQA